jgi:hypothetical protein
LILIGPNKKDWQFCYFSSWNYYGIFVGRYMQPLVSNVPIMVVEGNHEIEQQAENQTFVAYSSRFAFPSEESGSSSTFYYSFNAGGIHFIMLGAYISYDKSGELKFQSLSHSHSFLLAISHFHSKQN